MNHNLKEIFQKKKQQSAKNGIINWDERRDKYVAAVGDLYSQIEVMLAEPIGHKAVTLQRRPKTLSETYLGTYSVDDLILVIGDEQVRFSPRGRNIAGASGRVDILGEHGEEILLLQPRSRWGFVMSRQPTLRVTPFNEAALAEALKLVMRD